MDDINFWSNPKEEEDLLMEDEKVRSAYIAATGKYISYGDFRYKHPDLLPSVIKASKRTSRVSSVKKPKYTRLTLEEMESIANWYKKGYSVPVLASRYLVSEPTIIEVLVKKGLWEKRKPKEWTKEEIEIMRKLYFNGSTRQEIADYFDVTVNTLNYQIKKQGFEAEKRALSGGKK